MRYLKVISLACLLFFSFQLTGISDTGNDTIVFRWALYVKDKAINAGEKDTETIIKIGEENQVKPGQRIKFLFQPLTQTYIYLFLYTSKREMLLLFPGDFTLFENKRYFNDYYLFPPDREWRPLPGGSGREEFFLIASNKRHKDLEDLVLRTGKEDKMAPEAGSSLYEKLIILLQQHSSPDVSSEKFITIAGQLKDEGKDLITEVTSRSFYIKRFELFY